MTATTTTVSDKLERPIQVLVCDGDPTHDWPAIFRDHDLAPALAGRFRVVQASWMEISVVVYGGDRARTVVTAAPVHETGGVVRPATVTFEPDICVIRNQPRGPTPSSDRRAVLFGLMTGNVPALNSLESEYMQLERPLMCGGLRAIEQRLGHEQFPFIRQNFYTSSTAMVIAPALPAVVKVSHAHRGMGKILVDTPAQFRDVATVLALHDEYCTGESFVEAEYGIRIQKIGSHYRVLKKIPTGSGWKSQFGSCDLTETVCCSPILSHLSSRLSHMNYVSMFWTGADTRIQAVDRRECQAVWRAGLVCARRHARRGREGLHHRAERVGDRLQAAALARGHAPHPRARPRQAGRARLHCSPAVTPRLCWRRRMMG